MLSSNHIYLSVNIVLLAVKTSLCKSNVSNCWLIMGHPSTRVQSTIVETIPTEKHEMTIIYLLWLVTNGVLM